MRAKHKRKKKNVILKILITCCSLFFATSFAGAAVFLHYISSAPKLTDKKLKTVASPKIFDKDGKLIADLGKEKRELLTPKEIPEKLEKAIVSIEDKRFFQHKGVDVIRIFGSLFHNLTHSSLQGGSTLTQQLIKLSFFSTESSAQTLKRKIQEAWLACQLERRNSKQEILTYYTNKVFMGNRIYGMKTAAAVYYKKDIKNLSIAQTALLAGIPQAPSEYNPYLNPESAKNRRDTVLKSMLDDRKISQKEYEEAVATDIAEGLQPLVNNQEKKLKIIDPYLVEVIAEVKNKTGKNLWTDGLNIYTNIDLSCQKYLYEVVNTNGHIEFPDDKMQIAATVIDARTGKVRAQIGGRNLPENSALLINRATQNDRDWGSTVKPIVDYGPAIECLHYSTAQQFNDNIHFYKDTDVQVNDWDLQYLGWMTMRKAITLSRNVPAVEALEKVGLSSANRFLKKIGINYPELHYSNAISSNTNSHNSNVGISSLRIAAAYAAFANGGVYSKPYFVEKIVYDDGLEENYQPEPSRAMEEATAYIVTDLLKDVLIYGTGKNAKSRNFFEAGKTGTSNYSDEDIRRDTILQNLSKRNQIFAPDETFVGYTRNYAISVWCGYQNRLTPVLDKYFKIPGDIYREIMQFAMKNKKNLDWVKPKSVTQYGSELYLRNSPSYKSPNYSSSYSYSSKSSYSSSENSNSLSDSSETHATTTSTESSTDSRSVSSSS